MKFQYTNEHTFDKRYAEAHKARQKYSSRVPVILEKAPSASTASSLERKKYLIPTTLTVQQFYYLIRKRINLDSDDPLYIYVDNILPPETATMGALYNEFQADDYFLYVAYSDKND